MGTATIEYTGGEGSDLLVYSANDKISLISGAIAVFKIDSGTLKI